MNIFAVPVTHILPHIVVEVCIGIRIHKRAGWALVLLIKITKGIILKPLTFYKVDTRTFNPCITTSVKARYRVTTAIYNVCMLLLAC